MREHLRRKEIRILHLEDNAADGELVRHELAKGGLECAMRRVDSRKEFEEALREGTMDIILADLALPSFDGLSALTFARRDRPDIPFIFVAGTIGESSAIETLQLGATDYVLKEKLSRLAPSVRRALHEAEERGRRRRAEEKALEGNEFFRVITENADDLIALLDLDGRWVYCSPSYRTIFGDPPPRRGEDAFRDVHPGDRDRVRDVFRRTVSSGVGQRAEFRFVLRDGTVRYFESRANIVRDSHGNPSMALVVFRDVTDRRTAEETWRKLSAALESTGDAVMITDRDGVIEYVNPAFEAATGYDRAEAVGRKPSILKSGAQDHEYYRVMWQSLLAGETYHALFVNRRRNGELYDEEQTITPIVDRDGRITHFVSTGRDITERKRTDEALRSSEAKYRNIVTWAPVGIFKAAPDGTFLSVNPRLAEILGYGSSAELISRNLVHDVYVVPAEQERLIRQFESGSSVENLELKWKKKDGTPAWVHLSLHAVKGDNGRSLILEGYVTDTSERRKAENELALEKSHAEQLFENASAGIVLLDPDDRIINANTAFRRMFRYSLGELVGKNIAILLPPGPQAGAPAEARGPASGAVEVEATRRCKDGTLLDVTLSRLPIVVGGKAVAGYEVYVDVTEKKRFREQLRQAQKMESIGTLAGGIAHDFNNILGIIIGHASLLEQRIDDREGLSLSVNAITRAAQRGSSVVRQILTFARRGDASPEPVSMNGAVEEIAKMLGETFPRSVEIIMELDPALPVIQIDPAQLHQALLNLCVNARDAMLQRSETRKAGGTLTLATGVVRGKDIQAGNRQVGDSSYLCLRVSDTGIGMDERTREKIFEPFFTTKEPGKGTGLGLAVVYGVVSSYGGFITVDTRPGQGTTFRLYFPAHSAVQQAEEDGAPHAEPPPVGAETILLVEDEEALQVIVKAILEEAGYTVLTAGNGEEALRIYEERGSDIALLISDLGLPRIDGYDLFVTLKGRNPALKAIIASGYVESVERLKMIQGGVQDVLLKPYRARDILARIRTVLDGRE